SAKASKRTTIPNIKAGEVKSYSSKINSVKFHNFMKTPFSLTCKISQVKLHYQNKVLRIVEKVAYI
ncbi:hypothetical protein, partial [Vibrio azureus]|uniref:hypothetical protein n=1 Tax=Vibrio azureus TaxID=512649 RepID=UPI00058742A6